MNFVIGDTFEYAGRLRLDGPSGPITDFTGWGATSQIRTRERKALVASLVFEWTDATAGLFTLSFPGSTSGWKPGVCEMSIRFVGSAGKVVSTEPQAIVLTEPVTRDAA